MENNVRAAFQAARAAHFRGSPLCSESQANLAVGQLEAIASLPAEDFYAIMRREDVPADVSGGG